MKKLIVLWVSQVLLCLAIWATDSFSVHDYGELPNVRSVSISPDGKHYAFIKKDKAGDLFVIVDTQSNKVVGGANASAVKANNIYFLTNEHVVLKTSKTTRAYGIRGKWENSSARVFNLKTKKITPLLRSFADLYRAQSGLGRIVGFNAETNEVYMPAFVNKRSAYNLHRVSLETGKARTHAKGHQNTNDWFVDSDGQVLAREEYDPRKKEHSVKSFISGEWKKIYTKITDVPEIAVVAVSEDSKKLIFIKSHQNYDAVYSMNLISGDIQGPLYKEDGIDIDTVLTDGFNRKLEGIRYSGLLPSFSYFDEALQDRLAAIQQEFPSSAIYPVSANKDKSKLIVLISGNQAADDYYVYDAKTNALNLIARSYPQVGSEDIAEIKAIRYKARDGLSISAILTWPVGVAERKHLPLIVMPHGGPATYDKLHFDWMAQFFARKGYLVLQPNFRGSTGFGEEFLRAGHGKWGREMQDDVTDGVKAMVKTGYADPARVCIVGASYGGYSALAGGAFTPDTYKCVVSIAGVSDISLMLTTERKDYGRNHWVVNYWNNVTGKKKNNNLQEISPVHHATQFQAPLLLLHGKDDTVIPIRQSQVMLKAMQRAGKKAELISLKGEDHWLSSSDTRLELLKRIGAFLDEHNPTD